MAYTLYTNYKAKKISYGGGRTASQIKYIVIHYTANATDKAVNNAKYYANTNTRSAGAHYFVDENSVYQSIDDLKIAYSVGGSKYGSCAQSGGGIMYGKITNTNSISIELCSTGKKISEATKNNAVLLVKDLMKKYGIPASNIYRHFDVVGKACPSSLYTGSWSATDAWIGTNPTEWTDFQKRIGSTVEVKPDSKYTNDSFINDCMVIMKKNTVTDLFNSSIEISKSTNKNHALVTPFERYMKSLGYYSGNIEADLGKKPSFGSGMESAIKKYQEEVVKSSGKNIDGVVSAKGKTWKKLLRLA